MGEEMFQTDFTNWVSNNCSILLINIRVVLDNQQNVFYWKQVPDWTRSQVQTSSSKQAYTTMPPVTVDSWSSPLFFSFFKIDLFIWERKVWRDMERERESKQTACRCRVQCRAQSYRLEIMTWSETKSQTLTYWATQMPLPSLVFLRHSTCQRFTIPQGSASPLVKSEYRMLLGVDPLDIFPCDSSAKEYAERTG